MRQSSVTSYVHRGEIGVILEVSCESEFVAKSDRFRELIDDIAMQIAASGPKFIRKEHVSPELLELEKERYRLEAAATGMPEHLLTKIVGGRIGKYYEELCLYEQPFIKDRSISISQLIASRAGYLGEEISVRRFVRVKVGEKEFTIASDSDQGPEEGEGPGVTANRPKPPRGGIGSVAANPRSTL
jgi:elongation factor Ts